MSTDATRQPYFPIDAKGWRLAMGLRPLDMTNWLEVDENRVTELELKRHYLDAARDQVVATRPEGDEASAELLDEVVAWLRTNRPDIEFDVDVNEHPVVAASRLVQEDLCVLMRSDAWRLAAASVCFPSRWDLTTKIGRTLDEIHQPIPMFAEQLAGPTTSVFDRLKPERSFWRLNWTLIDTPDLFQPTLERRAPHGDLDQWFFRVERQTIRQLPASGAVVFTIHNYVSSASAMSERVPDFVELLLHALDTTPVAMQEYKGWIGVADRLRASLRQS